MHNVYSLKVTVAYNKEHMNEKGNTIEERVRRRARRERIQNIVLVSVYMATIAGAAVIMPNSMKLFKYVSGKIGPSPRLKKRMSQAYTRLVKEGMIARTGDTKNPGIILTKKGMKYAEGLEAGNRFYASKPRKWDYKWRILMFDIWERRRSVRNRLRGILQENGFVKIQNSVWIYPYPCEDLLIFLRTVLKLGPSIRYVVADEVERDEALRRHFRLPLE